MKHIFTTLIFFFFSFYSYSLNDATQVQTKKKTTETEKRIDNNINNTIDAENYYRLLSENSKNEADKYVSLLTTALTVIIALIIAIVGSSFFYNYRFNKKEFELITNETADKIKEVQKELMRQTKEEIDFLTKENKERINEEFGKISNTYKTNFDTLKDSLNTILMSFKQDVDKRLDKHDKILEELENAILTLEETAKEDLKVNEKSLKIDLLDIKGELYVIKGWHSLALSSFVEQANLCVETNNKWQIQYIVGDIISSINKVIEEDDTITTSTKLNIEKLIPEIPDSLSDKKKSIKENYIKIKVKDSRPYRKFGLGSLGIFGTSAEE